MALLASAAACSETLAPDVLTVDASTLHARLGEPFEAMLQAEGGEPPYVWRVDFFDGRAPAGFTLSADGKLSGMPGAIGEVTMSVRVRSADGRVGFADVLVRIWPDETPVLEPDERCADFPPWAVVTFEDEDLEGYVAVEADIQLPTYEESEPLTCEVVASLTRVARQFRTGYVTSLVGVQNLARTRTFVFGVDSITDLFRSASWNERECYDMFGIRFNGHPDLRRMYMPEDFEYHPLRKEFPLLGIPGSLPLPPQVPEGELTMDPFPAAHGSKPVKSFAEPPSEMEGEE